MKENNKFYRTATFYSTTELISYLNKSNFIALEIIQTVFGKLPKINKVQSFKTGYGTGGFVVINAIKIG